MTVIICPAPLDGAKFVQVQMGENLDAGYSEYPEGRDAHYWLHVAKGDPYWRESEAFDCSALPLELWRTM